MNRFRLSSRAKIDLAEIRRYIAQDNPPAADRFVGEFFDLFHLLAKSPEISQLTSRVAAESALDFAPPVHCVLLPDERRS